MHNYQKKTVSMDNLDPTTRGRTLLFQMIVEIGTNANIAKERSINKEAHQYDSVGAKV